MKLLQGVGIGVAVCFFSLSPVYAANVSVSPLSQDENCSTETEITVEGTSDNVILNFPPDAGGSFWYRNFSEGAYGPDNFGTLMGFSDDPPNCGSQAPATIYGNWRFIEVASTTYEGDNDCVNVGTYEACEPYILNLYEVNITSGSSPSPDSYTQLISAAVASGTDQIPEAFNQNVGGALSIFGGLTGMGLLILLVKRQVGKAG